MKRFTLIFLNEGLEHYEIDEPIGYEGKDYTKVTFEKNKNHQIEKITNYLKKYGFESKSYLLIEDGEKLDYFFLNRASQKHDSVEFNIVEPKTFRRKQIYDPTIV